MEKYRKTKIVCTIGPASDSEEMLEKLMDRGMNIARLNFSHGDHESHKLVADRIKKLREKRHESIGLLMDTKGPEIRTGEIKPGTVFAEGSELRILNQDVMGDAKQISVSYKSLHEDLVPGSKILIDDGAISLIVLRIDGRDIVCKVESGGPVSSRKSINLPETDIHLPVMTEQDRSDLRFAVQNDFDFIAASFIRKESDVVAMKRFLFKIGGKNINVISKIENREGVRNFKEILSVSDGIMVARGDLGVEIPAHEVPSIQKMMIRSCFLAGKPCITATQMLDSMIRNPRPTRAEASDVANAIYDGTSAIMLSGETAAGRYPCEALSTMDKIARFTEEHIDYWDKFTKENINMTQTVANAVSHACCTTAKDLGAKAIVSVTHSGRTPRLLSRFRPECQIIAPTVSKKAYFQLALSWGVLPYLVEEMGTTDELIEVAKKKAEESGVVGSGDMVVISAGTPVGMSGTTNTLLVHTIGDILARGIGLGKYKISGEALVVGDGYNYNRSFAGNYIVVAKDTSDEMIPLIRRAAGIVIEAVDEGSHASTIAMTLDIPLIYACQNATRLISNGAVITMDCEKGTVS